MLGQLCSLGILYKKDFEFTHYDFENIFSDLQPKVALNDPENLEI